MTLDTEAWPAEVLELVYQPWTIEVKPYPDGGYFARVVELPGCMTEADTAAEVVEALEEARAAWLAAATADGRKIPSPLDASDYSGKIFVRTSPELHRAVAEAAAKEGVSMSQWASEVLARGAATRGVWSGSSAGKFLETLEQYQERYAEAIGGLKSLAEALEAANREIAAARPPSDSSAAATKAS